MVSFYFQALAKGGVTYRDEPWHKECFVCTSCKVQLAGQHFTSRDDSPYCIKCFGNLYAKKCEACSKPITGEEWHALPSLSFSDRMHVDVDLGMWAHSDIEHG